jgi:heme oxygenase
VLSSTPDARSHQLCDHLRKCTASAHDSLESKLDLLSAPSRGRLIALLKAFYGFHSVWEPALSRWPRLFELMASRSRLADLRADLMHFGFTDEDVSQIAHCRRAAELLQSEAAAVGSAYVLEGSTLGGQVISRLFDGADYVPKTGLAYFNPYGAATGEMWRAFKAAANVLVPGTEYDVAAEGAWRTFALLEQWVCN